MRYRTPCLVAVAVLVVLSAVGPAFGVAALEHEPDRPRNQTMYPVEAPEDRRPGIDDASYKRWAAPNEDPAFQSLQYIEYAVTVWDEGVLGQCELNDAEVSGIDRGNDDPGTEVDEEIGPENVQAMYESEDRVTIEFATPDDPFGEPVHFNASDEFVSWQTDCFGNPDEPGWYRIWSKMNGTTWDGEHVEFEGHSHYFWICDCEDEAEARERLGPPPSEDGDSADTATPTPTATAAAGTQETAAGTAAGTATAPASTAPGTAGTSGSPSTATRTAADTERGADADGADTPTPTVTPAAWARGTDVVGPGFDTPVAALAVAIAALLLARR